MAQKPEYHVEEMSGSYAVDRRIFLSVDDNEKTPEQLRKEFYKKWGFHLFHAFPILQEGETQKQVLESGELYQRPHTEIYFLTVTTGTHQQTRSRAVRPGIYSLTVTTGTHQQTRSRAVRPSEFLQNTTIDQDISHIKFMHDAKLAGLHIEAVVAHDVSKPWYRRVLRQEPRKTQYTFILTSPPRSAPTK